MSLLNQFMRGETLMSAQYVLRGVRLYIWRCFSEDMRGTAFILTLQIALSATITLLMSRELQEIPLMGLKHVVNIYLLTFGVTLGFLSSVAASSIGSIFHSDRVSGFLEVLLSTPLSIGRYIAILTFSSIVYGLFGSFLSALAYTLSLSILHETIRVMLLNIWVYLTLLFMTMLTSLLNVVTFLIAARTSIDPSKLSMIPSLALFLGILLARGLGAEIFEDQFFYMLASVLASAIIALALILIAARKMRLSNISFSSPP